MPAALTGRAAARRASSPSMAARGRVCFWQGGSLWIGRGSGRTQWHQHHAHQITLPFAGACRLRTAADGDWSEYRGVFVPSRRPHQFEIDDVAAAQLFVEPETTAGRALARRFGNADVAALPEPERAAMAALLQAAGAAGAADIEAAVAAAQAAVALLAGTVTPAGEVDARIGKALRFIQARVREPITLADAAAAVALSPGRFRHLFVQQTGAAFRAYLLWLRLNAAIECSMAGGSWTEAAHEAGFADSAHLSRTFKRMFGMNAAMLVRR